MARKGDQARTEVTNRILEAFPGSFISEKKIYVNTIEGGEPIQFAIALTMPKIPVVNAAGGSDTAGNHDWSENATTATPIEITPEDDAKVTALMERLGIKD